ncbi:MAG TPA: sensor histidine kinase [Methylotenera sp.]|nr:sensor histidine kinase [Methylotenera sp.]HPM49326.1 sensor histidine kinase [Methylotenera sp.]
MLKKPLSIRQLLLLAFLLAGLLPAMLVSFLSFYQARIALKSEISHDLQTLSNTVASNVESMLFERFHNVHAWSELAIMQDIQIGDIDKRLATFLQELVISYGGIYQKIEVVDTNNVIVASSVPKNLGLTTQPFDVWFQVNIGQKTIDVYPIETHQTASLAISKAILSPDAGKVQGRLIAYFNWQLVLDKLNQSVQDSTAAALFDEQNHAIASTRNWAKIHAEHGMHANSTFSGSTSPKWRVEIEKLHSVAVAPVHRLGYVFLALLITTLVFATFLVTPIAKAVTAPLSQLTHFVRHFFLDQTSQLPTSGPAEVQELSSAFKKMISELEASQKNLERAAKLAVVGEMAAAMSHEVRTPLGILRSSANVLQREPQLSKEGHEVLGFIISETERLNNLVSSLIDAARPRLPAFTEVNLSALAIKCIAMLSAQAQTKNVQLDCHADQDYLIKADSEQMTQVLMNLLINAIQMLPNHGKVEVGITALQDTIQLTIADNGPGIPAGSQAQIFEPFFTQRAGGVGLGLAVVRQIVHAHQGEISYSPSQQGGAQFNITLPKLTP